MQITCLLGAPGSGKGTFGRRLAENLNVFHFSIGDCLRARRKAGRFNDNKEVLSCLDRGELLSSEQLLPLLKAEVEAAHKLGHRVMILDGFPRTFSQGMEFEILIQKFDLVICLQCPREAAKQRFLCRKLPDRLHQDNAEMFDKRCDEYEAESPALVQHYGSIGTLVNVDSSGQVDSTYANLFDALKDHDHVRSLLKESES